MSGCNEVRVRTEDCDYGNTENIMVFLMDQGRDNCFSRATE